MSENPAPGPDSSGATATSPSTSPSTSPASACATTATQRIRGNGLRDACRILFVGGGNMASAMINGLVAAGMAAARIAVVEPHAAARQALSDKLGTTVFPDVDSLPADLVFDAIVLAVKPQQAATALRACGRLLERNRQAVLISIAAGLGIDLLVAMSGGHRRTVRAMPNTPALIGEGISGLFIPADMSPRDGAIAEAILASTGSVVKVAHEALIDTVTAVSGSGPAYAFYLMEAMAEAGIAGGLDAATARQLAITTVKGAALLALASQDPPEVLRARVTSPAGTTAAAVAVLDERQAKSILHSAIRAAAVRSQELSAEAASSWQSPT